MPDSTTPTGLDPSVRFWLAVIAMGLSLIVLGMTSIDLIHHVPDSYHAQHAGLILGGMAGVCFGIMELTKRPALRLWLTGLTIGLVVVSLTLILVR